MTLVSQPICLADVPSGPFKAADAERRLSRASGVETNARESAARCHVERLAVAVAERKPGREFRRNDHAQVTAIRRKHPDAAGTYRVQIPSGVELHPVGIPRTLSGTHVCEQPAVANAAIALHFVANDGAF